MRFEFGLYSSLLLIFFVHGLVYSLLLFSRWRRNGVDSDKWLSLFLLLCILYIAPWMLGFAGWYDNQPYRDILFYTPFVHLYFIGPVLFFYVKSLLSPSARFQKKDWLHFVPGMAYLLFTAVVFVVDKLVRKEYYFLADGSDPDFDRWYQYSGFLSMLLYFLGALRYYTIFKKLMLQLISYADAVQFKWVRNFLTAFLVMLAVKLVFYAASFSPVFEKYIYIASWWDYFAFALLFYYIALMGYVPEKRISIRYKIDLLEQKQLLLLSAREPIDTVDAAEEESTLIDIQIDQPAAENPGLVAEWKDKILVVVQGNKAYEDPDLSLTQLARQIQTNPGILSRVINQGFGLNFNDFINHYRVEAVKDKLAAGVHQQHTLMGIAYDCGFNSKATFNRAFKKNTGQSPSAFIKALSTKGEAVAPSGLK
ncbi:MAG: AraC family transcriptional regulator [Chitinophagaceae bacterium]|nr:MAG: AraC family transcriptional regulator [Chitinophagaceae bacterium]